MAVAGRNFQPPKGMRDFYPQDMAVRRYLEGVWRRTAINHGFEEVEGPTFENIELYTHKSGPGIVSEIFGVFSGKDEAELAQLKALGRAPFALRPEFTPTLARMIAARADSLPKPIKWFAIPTMFRAERPQRGRLREHVQWNVDCVGEQSSQADAEVIAAAISALEALGLQSIDITIKLNHRELVAGGIRSSGVSDDNIEQAMALLDKRAKLPEAAFLAQCSALRFDFERFAASMVNRIDAINSAQRLREKERSASQSIEGMEPLPALIESLASLDALRWCAFDYSVVRGLAYYTGTVFEIHEATGADRAIAGGGRYDNLIESFDGPSLPACGFGMGDVVLSLVLHDKGLLPEDVYMNPLRPHAFVIAADDDAAAKLPGLVAQLRRAGFHVRHSYKSTRNVGKLLSEAGRCRALTAIILGKDLHENKVDFKDLESGEQRAIALDEIEATLRMSIDRGR